MNPILIQFCNSLHILINSQIWLVTRIGQVATSSHHGYYREVAGDVFTCYMTSKTSHQNSQDSQIMKVFVEQKQKTEMLLSHKHMSYSTPQMCEIWNKSPKCWKHLDCRCKGHDFRCMTFCSMNPVVWHIVGTTGNAQRYLLFLLLIPTGEYILSSTLGFCELLKLSKGWNGGERNMWRELGRLMWII